MSKANRLLKLMDPFHSMFYRDNETPAAPGGKWALSKDKTMNEAMWNALVVAATATPVAYFVARLANRKAKKDIQSKSDAAVVDSVNSLKPRLDPSYDLFSSKTLGTRGVELKRILDTEDMIERAGGDGLLYKGASALSKKAFDDSKASYRVAKRMLEWGLPVTTVIAALYGGASLANKAEKEKQKEELEKEYAMLRKMQDVVDADILERRGLIPKQNNKAAVDMISKEASKLSGGAIYDFTDSLDNATDTVTEGVADVGIRLPLGLMATIFALSAIGGAAYLHKNNKDVAKLEYLKKHMLGENRLSETPEISIPERLMASKTKQNLQRINL